MKNIFHDFGDLKEGKALGIVSDDDVEYEGGESSDGFEDMPEVKKVIASAKDNNYKPNKRVCTPERKTRTRSIRKSSGSLEE